MPDDGDRSDGPRDDGDWAVDMVVPDDARELDEDVVAYRRELRTGRRHLLLHTITATRGWRRAGAPALMVLGVIGTVAAITALMTFVRPTSGTSLLPQRPLAQPTVPAGRLDGLVPPVTLTGEGHSIDSVELRPALVALLPVGCGCQSLVDDLAGQALEFDLPLVLVGPTAGDREVFVLAREARRGYVEGLLDPTGTLARSYAAAGPTVLMLEADGRVTAVVRGVTARLRLEPQLVQMTGSG